MTRLSQREVIDLILGIVPTGNAHEVVVAAGLDDVGVIRVGDSCIALTTDYVNFRPLLMTLGVGGWDDLGFLLVVQNVSDLLASGATPTALLLAIGVPKDTEASDLRAFAEGVREAAEFAGVYVLGGDTKQAAMRSLGATAIGMVGPGGPWRVSGGRPGDVLLVSGAIGGVTASAWHFAQGPERDSSLDAEARVLLTRPRLPVSVAASLRRVLSRGAATDISDGLGADLSRMLVRSAVGVDISAALIPFAPETLRVAARYSLPPLECAFGLGGDGQFLVAVDPSDADAAQAAGAVAIGRLTDGEARLLVDGEWRPLPTFGHEDFRDRDLVGELLQLLGGERRG